MLVSGGALAGGGGGCCSRNTSGGGSDRDRLEGMVVARSVVVKIFTRFWCVLTLPGMCRLWRLNMGSMTRHQGLWMALNGGLVPKNTVVTVESVISCMQWIQFRTTFGGLLQGREAYQAGIGRP